MAKRANRARAAIDSSAGVRITVAGMPEPGGGHGGPLRLAYRVTCAVPTEATQLLVSTVSFTTLVSSAQASTR